MSCQRMRWGMGGGLPLKSRSNQRGTGVSAEMAWKKAVICSAVSGMAASSRRLRSALLSCAEGWGVSFRAMPLAEGMGSMWLTAPMTLPVMRPLERARKPEKKAMERRGAGQWGLLGGIEAVPLHQHPVILPLNGHVGDGAVGGPVVHVAVAGAVQGQMAEEASSVAGGHGYAVLDSLAQTLHRGQGGAAVHLDPLPPDGVGADGLVEEQRVGAQTAQVKGLPLLLNEFGQAGGQVRQHPLAKRQVRVVIGHDMDQRLLAQRGDIALLTIL